MLFFYQRSKEFVQAHIDEARSQHIRATVMQTGTQAAYRNALSGYAEWLCECADISDGDTITIRNQVFRIEGFDGSTGTGESHVLLRKKTRNGWSTRQEYKSPEVVVTGKRIPRSSESDGES